MLQYLSELWHSGSEGNHVEELVGNVFADFAPYAGSDQQRLTITRQHGTEALTSLIIEDNGEWAVSCTHANLGSMLFSTTGELRPQVALRLPLRTLTLPPCSTSDSSTGTRDKSSTIFALSTSSSASSALSCDTPTTDVPTYVTNAADTAPRPSTHVRSATPSSWLSSSSPRFATSGRGAFLLHGLPRFLAGSHNGQPGWGQVEFDGPVESSLLGGRQSYGIRCGPCAFRLTSTPHQDESRKMWIDESEEGASSHTRGVLARFMQRRYFQHTTDVALCLPLKGTDAGVGAAAPVVLSDNTGSAPTNTPTRTTTPPQWLLTVGMQHPVPYGDTLAAVCLQSDRHTGVHAEVRSDSDRLDSSGTQRSDCARFCGNVGLAEPYNAFRMLLVQTLQSRFVAPMEESELRGLTRTQWARRVRERVTSSNQSWYNLPTLVGCNMSFAHQLLRLSAAAIFHESAMDLESAVVMDVTPLTSRTPTLVRLGWNNTGRLALGITSLVANVCSITLGIHHVRGEDVRFGLEIKM